MVDDWLSMSESDGRLERTVRLSSSDEVQQGKSLLQNNIKRKFFDDHIWLSIGYRKSRSTFTRVQRLCCCVSILYLMMVTNAMWYGKGNATGNQAALVIGPISITVMQLYTSLMSSVIVVPPILLITTIFTKVSSVSRCTHVRTHNYVIYKLSEPAIYYVLTRAYDSPLSKLISEM